MRVFVLHCRKGKAHATESKVNIDSRKHDDEASRGKKQWEYALLIVLNAGQQRISSFKKQIIVLGATFVALFIFGLIRFI